MWVKLIADKRVFSKTLTGNLQAFTGIAGAINSWQFILLFLQKVLAWLWYTAEDKYINSVITNHFILNKKYFLCRENHMTPEK